MPILAAFEALNRRVYGGWDTLSIAWEGPSLPPYFRRAQVRFRQRFAGAEERALDAEWASESFAYHYLLGLAYGYPECCTMAYAVEAPHLPVARERRVGYSEYVPCAACLDKWLEHYAVGLPAGPAPAAAVL